jgi:glycosyltransferase involved in cell wall biosynthesis
MSMLVAAACGLPLIVNDTMQAVERIEGNGISHRLSDLDDLVRALRDLNDPVVRAKLGQIGAERMRERFSWSALARRRLRDYEEALGHSPRKHPEPS